MITEQCMQTNACGHLITSAKRGFTLVELLIVIVILSLLLGLLIPSIQSISRQSLVTADFGNLRSLQSAHYQYAVDSKGRFADAGLSHGGLANEKIAWLNTLGEYVDIKGVIRSPLDTSPHWEMPLTERRIAVGQATDGTIICPGPSLPMPRSIRRVPPIV